MKIVYVQQNECPIVGDDWSDSVVKEALCIGYPPHGDPQIPWWEVSLWQKRIIKKIVPLRCRYPQPGEKNNEGMIYQVDYLGKEFIPDGGEAIAVEVTYLY